MLSHYNNLKLTNDITSQSFILKEYFGVLLLQLASLAIFKRYLVMNMKMNTFKKSVTNILFLCWIEIRGYHFYSVKQKWNNVIDLWMQRLPQKQEI